MLLAEAELWVTAWMSADGTKNLYLPGQMCTWMGMWICWKTPTASAPDSGRAIRQVKGLCWYLGGAGIEECP